MRRLMIAMVVFGAGCGGASTSQPAAPSDMSEEMEKKDNAVEPEDSSAASPDAVATPSSDTDQVIRQYSIEGEPVDQATYKALFDRLVVDATPYSGETVENPDGSFGGAGEVYHARDGDILYRYEFHTYPREDGKVGESYMVSREDTP